MSRFHRALNVTLVLTVLCLASSAAAAAQANSSTEVAQFPFSLRLTTGEYPCLEEDVFIYGTLQEVAHTTFDASGGRHRTTLFSAQGLTAVGLTTGTEFQVSGPGHSIFNDDDLTPPVRERSFFDVITLVGPGRVRNLRVSTRFHVTFNANGERVVFTVAESVACH